MPKKKEYTNRIVRALLAVLMALLFTSSTSDNTVGKYERKQEVKSEISVKNHL